MSGLSIDAAARAPSAPQRAARRDRWRGALLAGPAVLWTVAFFLLPSAAIALWSLFRREGGVLVTSFGLDNYRRIFEQEAYTQALLNSLQTTLLVTVISLLLAYPLAYVIACRVPARWQRLLPSPPSARPSWRRVYPWLPRSWSWQRPSLPWRFP